MEILKRLISQTIEICPMIGTLRAIDIDLTSTIIKLYQIAKTNVYRITMKVHPPAEDVLTHFEYTEIMPYKEVNMKIKIGTDCS